MGLVPGSLKKIYMISCLQNNKTFLIVNILYDFHFGRPCEFFFKWQSWIITNLCYQTLIRNQKFLLIKGSNKCVFGWRILHSSQSLFITSVLFSLSFRILLVSVFIELLKIIYVLPAHWVRQYLQKRRSPLIGRHFSKDSTLLGDHNVCPQ